MALEPRVQQTPLKNFLKPASPHRRDRPRRIRHGNRGQAIFAGGIRSDVTDARRALGQMICERQLTPRIGGISLQQLTPGDVQRCLDDLRASGARSGGPLSARSVQYAATVLKMSLAQQ
jgi:hypothetical protein